MTNFGMMVSSLKQNIARAVVGKDDVVELMLTALLCEGHVLIEDVPGVGKTTLASALARSLSCSFKRIQFTPDITPSDITGFTMPSLSGEMQYHPGAIMSQIVLARRNQPHLSENAVRAAGGYGRAAGDGGRRDLSPRAALYGAGDAEPGGFCRHLSPAGSADGPLLHARFSRLSLFAG